MKKVINIYKPIGVTPLKVINTLKKEKPKLKNIKIAYAGRLDPLAEGVLLLLVEPETKNAKKYQKLDKEYEFEVLFGVRTDSYDVLGVVQEIPRKPRSVVSQRVPQKQVRNSQVAKSVRGDKAGMKSLPALSKEEVIKAVESFIGKHKQLYPPFSSKTVKGRPLFWWARKGKLDDIEIPTKNIEIYDIKLLSVSRKDIKILRDKVIKNIKLVKGDFRQKEILKRWKDYFNKQKGEKLVVAKLKVHCSSGTYVRWIAHELGEKLGCGAIALLIKRTAVGKYGLGESLEI